MDRTSATLNDETTELYREIDKLKADLRQVRSDFASVGGDALRTARAGFNETLKVASAQSKAAAETAEKQISTHPFIAVAAAFALGMFIGFRVTRRN